MDDGGNRGPGLLDASELWTDSLDDMSHVYKATDVQVSGGEVRLAPGKDKGWIASEIISARPGLRYDYVLLDARTPGNSSVEISILDVSVPASPAEPGFANGTVNGYKGHVGTHLNIYNILPKDYPELRIQVNLVADGTDHPVLLGWSLSYIREGEWRDEFLGPWKMSKDRGLNFTGEGLEINLSDRGRKRGISYDPYPPAAIVMQQSVDLKILYPNAPRSGYEDVKNITFPNAMWGTTFDDLDSDGFLDLIIASRNGNWVKILWGDSSGNWSDTHTTTLQSVGAIRIDTGDFDGDGWIDIAVASTNPSHVFLNQGAGTFNTNPDIKFLGQHFNRVSVGDFDGDGYNDILFSRGQSVRIYYGGDNGPDLKRTTVLATQQCWDHHVKDINKDGYDDVLLAEWLAAKTRIFLGGFNGVGANPDYSFALVNTPKTVAAGDINGDGFVDLAYAMFVQGIGYRIHIFYGDKNGWSINNLEVTNVLIDGWELIVEDIDNDGFDDVAHITWRANQFLLEIYKGGAQWPANPFVSKEVYGNTDFDFAIPKSSSGIKAYRAGFTTTAIVKPPLMKWDLLHLDGTLPKNTTMTLSVLDGDGLPFSGYEDLAVNTVDLEPLSYCSTLRAKVELASEFNHSTPVFDYLIVKWMGKMYWRDEFYGPIRADRMLGFDINHGSLLTDPTPWSSDQLAVSVLRNDSGYDTDSLAYFDNGSLEFTYGAPMPFYVKGASALDVADDHRTGYKYVAFAVHRTSENVFSAESKLFNTTPTGWPNQADHRFPTVGATDVLLEDLNQDGNIDVVFAQERNGTDYFINSTLYWGNPNGWNHTPDMEFLTNGATGVEATDIDGDGFLDLVFACSVGKSLATDSLVFIQGTKGFKGTTPSDYLPTHEAHGVASGDLNGDGHVDLVFANRFWDGDTEIDSWIYWGEAGGGFENQPTGLPTVGAEDVKVADMNNDGHLDIIFANSVDNAFDRNVSSFVYLNDKSGGFSSSPDHSLPAVGAVAVAVADLDGTGWKDLLFACHHNGTTFSVPSVVYLGGRSGWSSTPDIVLPTEGASDIMAVQLAREGSGGYISGAITPNQWDDIGTFNTLRCNATLDATTTGTLQLVDALTEEVLAERALTSGYNEWSLKGLFRYREHQSVRVVVIGEGLEDGGVFEVDDIWMNWSKRVRMAPVVSGLELSATSVYRLNDVTLKVNASDEYDTPWELSVTIEYCLNGTGNWMNNLLKSSRFRDSTKPIEFSPLVDTQLGSYDFRVMVDDTDFKSSSWFYLWDALQVLNNIPSAPRIILSPAQAITTSSLQVDISQASWDVENTVMTYVYRWYLDGVLREDLTTNMVNPSNTTKDQNWSVEVTAWDGDDESPPAIAWRVIDNARPATKLFLADIVIDEDAVGTDLVDLSEAFWDPDGDELTYTVEPTDHIQVEIDQNTGRVTFIPENNWNGKTSVTFKASDGELRHHQNITVHVTPVNDIPMFATVNNEIVGDGPIEITILQGDLLEIDVFVLDEEGDELVFDTNSTLIDLDSKTGDIHWQPNNDEVGEIRFSLSVWDTVTPGEKSTIDFIVTVENINDPMSDPVITSPKDGKKFEWGEEVPFDASCFDPDLQFGQLLNFTWSSNNSGVIGHGSSFTINLTDVGTHVITLTVTDGEFESRSTVTIEVEPKEVIPDVPRQPEDPGEPKPFNYGPVLAIVIVLVIVGVALFVAKTRRQTEELEEFDEEQYKREHMERAHAAVKEAADILEASKEEAPAPKGDPELELEEIDIASTEVPQMSLSMEAKKTEVASKETMALFDNGSDAEPVISDEEHEKLRVENLKRNYQNAIGRLPYGIPSEELSDWDWVELAAALATGEKRMTSGGRETTEIDGRWYYSDSNDTGSFLKEHGAKPKEVGKKSAKVTMDREELLAKLDERFILGEISEEAYNKLMEKYSKG
jgi:hypothetical protein